jgi:Uri superfamily endonuclease
VSQVAGYVEFEFDLPEALLTHLIRVLDALHPAPLDTNGVAAVPEAQGVYQLFLDGQLVYIGKTDAEAGLRKRLERHASKIQHRQGLDPARVSFRAVRIFVFTAIDLETQLIRHYAAKGTAWNKRGFGSNDPGRRRDHTRIKPINFDALYPIDIDRPLPVDFASAETAADVVIRLKQALPYTFRFEATGGRRPDAALSDTRVRMAPGERTAREVLVELTTQLPPGWQATAFRHQLLLYPEAVDTYPDAEILARS